VAEPVPTRRARVTAAGVSTYLDHAASTTPMRPRGHRGHAPVPRRRVRQPVGEPRESRGPGGRWTTPASRSPACWGPTWARWSSRRGGPRPTTWPSPAAGRDRRRAAGRRASWCARPWSTTPCSTCRALARPDRSRAAGGGDRQGRDRRPRRAGRGLHPDVALVSVMAVNNEIGTVQPLEASGVCGRPPRPPRRCSTPTPSRRCPGSMWPLAPTRPTWWPSAPTSSAGPRGSAPWSSGPRTCRPPPVLHGGGQERERRSGTHNVAGIVGMAAALAATVVVTPGGDGGPGDGLRDRLGDGLVATVAGTAETGDRGTKVAGHLHLRFAGVESEALVVLLDGAGVAVSAGAACSSGAVEASHVLTLDGLRPDEAAERHPASRSGDHHRRRRRPGPGRRSGCGRPAARLSHARVGGHVRRCRLVGGRALLAERWAPPGGGGHPQAVGRCLGLGVLLGGRRGGRPPGGRPAGPGPPRVQLRREFEERVVDPYVRGHAEGRTPNPCIECNRHLKFDRCSGGPGPSVSTPWPPAITPVVAHARGRSGCAVGLIRTRTSPTCWPCWARTSWPAPCSRWAR
jgi:hypothetical protein